MASEDWTARRAELESATGEDWDRLHEALERDWKAAYREAFVREALRRGWDRENALAWAGEVVDDAFLERRSDWPRLMARDDVRACEMEAANA